MPFFGNEFKNNALSYLSCPFVVFIYHQTVVIKVLSFNIHKGFNFHGLRYTLSSIRQALESSHSDLVFLQEITGLDRSTNRTQFEYLADQLWEHVAYGKNAITSNGHHGNAILSKFRFEKWNNLNISTNSFEQRGLLHGVVSIPHLDMKLHVLNAHLNLTHGGRLNQIEKVSEYIQSEIPPDAPIILAGDFNDWTQELHRKILTLLNTQECFSQKTQKLAKTFPSFLPILSLDRIYVRRITTLNCEIHTQKEWKKLSDHLALSVQLELNC